MAVVRNIADLSQIADLNGPDGAVDPPSVLDDQDRYLGSFIAMLRDGVGFKSTAITTSLGFTPVRQGTGAGQLTNTVSIGWSSGNRLLVSVDTNAFANKWPIDIDGTARGIRSAGTGAEIQLNWADPGDVPAYVFGGNSPTDGRVTPPSRLTVGRANTAGSADSTPWATTAGNANAVSGVSGWNYSNRNYNPPYLWATAGSAQDQFLVSPGNLSVNYASTANYANSAGSAPANGGTATNSQQLQGRADDFWINNSNSAVRSLRNNATIQMIAWSAGIGDMFWGASVSDERLKTGIVNTEVDSLAQIEKIRFVGYRFREDLEFQVDPEPGHFHPLGLIAQEAEQIEPEWIVNAGTWKQPDQYALVLTALHAIQQLADQVKALQARLQGAA
jgi:hypothetical protein